MMAARRPNFETNDMYRNWLGPRKRHFVEDEETSAAESAGTSDSDEDYNGLPAKRLSLEPHFRDLTLHAGTPSPSSDAMPGLKETKSYNISAHRVYVSSLEDSDEEDMGNVPFELHPDYERVLKQRLLPVPSIPSEGENKSLVLYKPIGPKQVPGGHDGLVVEDVSDDISAEPSAQKGQVQESDASSGESQDGDSHDGDEMDVDM